RLGGPSQGGPRREGSRRPRYQPAVTSMPLARAIAPGALLCSCVGAPAVNGSNTESCRCDIRHPASSLAANEQMVLLVFVPTYVLDGHRSDVAFGRSTKR